VWFLLDVIRKFSLVLCALAADGSSTPFDLPRWYVPGKTPVVTTLLLSLVTLAVGQPYRHLRHQCHEALALACLILVAQTADSTFAGWATVGLTLVITLHVYRRHRDPLGQIIEACKQARWRRSGREYISLRRSDRVSSPSGSGSEQEVTDAAAGGSGGEVSTELSGGGGGGVHAAPAAFVANV